MQGMDKEAIILLLVAEKVFEIDDEGRIWRLMKRHGRGVAPGGGYLRGSRLSHCPRVRAEYRTRQGYLLVAAMLNGRKTVTGAHRVVWASRNGSIPAKLTINHRNGKKADNRPENLELATYSEQRRHALEVLNVHRHRPTGSRHPKTKLLESDVIEMRRLRLDGMMVKEIAARYSMKPKAVSAICNRRTWQHI